MNLENAVNTTSRLPAAAAEPPSLPWWRYRIMWMTLGLPASVVVASLYTAGIAWSHIDPVVTDAPAAQQQAAEEVAEHGHRASPMEPAEKARNHAATPEPK
jgi:hypothetical protein